MDAFDVLGRRLPEALQMLRQSGVDAHVAVTGKNSATASHEEYRVVKAVAEGQRYSLTVCLIPDAYR